MNDPSDWQKLGPFFFNNCTPEQVEERVTGICRLTGVESGKLLDLACGEGHYSVAFAQRGFSVTGVDFVPAFIRQGERIADGAGVEVEWIVNDMREFRRIGEFNMVVSICSNYHRTHEENMQVLRNVRGSLAKGGRFLIDVMGKEILARIFEPTGYSVGRDGSGLVARRWIRDNWSRVDVEWMIVAEGRTETLRFSHELYSAVELEQMLRKAGFSSVTTYGSWTGAPYDEQATRLIQVAEV